MRALALCGPIRMERARQSKNLLCINHFSMQRIQLASLPPRIRVSCMAIYCQRLTTLQRGALGLTIFTSLRMS